MELRGYGSLAKRWWFALLLAAWGGGLLGYVATVVLPPTYEARTQFLVGPIDAGFTIQRASGNLARTFADLATSQDLLISIAAEIPGLDGEMLEDSIRTTASDATRLVSISLQQTDPNLAAQAANAIVERLIEITGSPNPEGQITVIDVAAVPEEPIGPSVPLVIGMAAGAALVGTVLLLFLWESASGVIRGREEAVELSGASVLAVLRRSGTLFEPVSGSGSFVLLSAHLAATAHEPDRRMVILGTFRSDDSSAWTGAQLAADVAAAGRTVTLLDAGDGATTDLLAGLLVPSAGSTRDSVDVQLPTGPVIGLVPFPAHRPPSEDVAPADDGESGTLLICAESADAGTAHAWIDAVGRVVVVVTKDQTRRDDLVQTASALSMLGAELTGIIMVEPVGRLGGRFGRRRTAAGRAAGVPAAHAPSTVIAPADPGSAGTTAAMPSSPPAGTLAVPEGPSTNRASRRRLRGRREDANPRTQP